MTISLKQQIPSAADRRNQQAPPVPPSTLRIRSNIRRTGNLLLEMSIGQRLTLGFLVAAMIATLVASLVGVLRSQALSRQSDFYQHLLQVNTSLTTGTNFLQLMNTATHTYIDTANSPQPSQETLNQQRKAIQDLTTRYDTILNTYTSQDLLSSHPDQLALLAEANNAGQATQQVTLLGSSARTWRLYRSSQDQILQDVTNRDISNAQLLVRSQAEPTNADAISAMRALIQLNQHLANSVHEAAAVEEQTQLVTTIIGALLAFLAILLVGWFISGTLIRRLKQLRQVTQAVENGQFSARVNVVGRDEIADVSASVNAMLEAIVRLLDETRNQRDALTNAAEHLFSDMRVVSAGDLRINAPVSDDPIGMLANAFNFTVSRFRRFVLRVQTTVEQIDVVARQEIERAESFAQFVNTPQSSSPTSSKPLTAKRSSETEVTRTAQEIAFGDDAELIELVLQVRRTRERLQKLAVEGIHQRTSAVQALTEQITLVASRLSTTLQRETERQGNVGDITQMHTMSMMPSVPSISAHMQELRLLENLLQRTVAELQGVQQSTIRGFIELDRDLTNLTHGINKFKGRAQSNTAPILNKELGPDMLRQGVGFSSEISTLARKLTALTQELRLGIISFQLDASENASNSTLSSPGVMNRVPANYDLPTGVVTPQQNISSSSRSRTSSRPLNQ